MPKTSSRRVVSKRNPDRRNKKQEVFDVHETLARGEGPAKKNWTEHDLVAFRPKTENQHTALQLWFQGDDMALLGAAGVGKTHLATYMAASALVDPESSAEKIIIVRSAAPGRDQGFLPGNEEEKLAPYDAAYRDSLAQVFGAPTTYKHMIDSHRLEFTSTSFKRGVNFRDAVVILEEVQNFNFQELHTLVTRLNDSCRLIITGDDVQCDLGRGEVSSIARFRQIIPLLYRMSTVEFTWEDCLRGERVKQWLKAISSGAA